MPPTADHVGQRLVTKFVVGHVACAWPVVCRKQEGKEEEQEEQEEPTRVIHKNTVASRYESNAPGLECSDRIEHALQAAERVHNTRSTAKFLQACPRHTAEQRTRVVAGACVRERGTVGIFVCACVCVLRCVCVVV
jgi:hypothetical protein